MTFGMKRHPILSRAFKGLAVAIASFVGFGTVAALWENPLFIRMTPAGDFEIALLTLLSILLGVYVAIRGVRQGSVRHPAAVEGTATGGQRNGYTDCQ